MMPNLNPKQLEQAMKKLGVKQEKIDAYEVVIKTREKNLVVKDPEVLRVNMMGQESFQITGSIEEEMNITEDDVNTVASQAGVSKDKARESLEKNKGDLASAIMELKNN
ncbi:nascent polypeptide-associated complex protein [Candidatus Woesearchaeota archaeon]|nr:nascent polypeptide-associated complex protein [Candidatus Woesearchaeota archaeon]